MVGIELPADKSAMTQLMPPRAHLMRRVMRIQTTLAHKKALAEQELAGGLKPTAQPPRKGVAIFCKGTASAIEKPCPDLCHRGKPLCPF